MLQERRRGSQNPRYADFVASLELQLLRTLSAGAKTVTDVARALGIRHAEAARELSAATMSGLITWEDVDGHFTSVDAARRFAHLSTAGLERLQRLQDDEAAGR